MSMPMPFSGDRSLVETVKMSAAMVDSTKGNVIVHIFAGWSSYSREWERRLPELQKQMGGDVHVLQVDFDDQDNWEAFRTFDVKQTPCFLFFAECKCVGTLVGNVPAEEIVHYARRLGWIPEVASGETS